MASRIQMKDLVDNAYYKELMTTERSQHNHHLTTRMCRNSRWPFTDKLTTDQIYLMRDTYMGQRRNPTMHQTKHVYDKIFHADDRWDQMAGRDTRIIKRPMITAAYAEDNVKPVPALTNNTYGKRHAQFYDWLSRSPANRSEYSYHSYIYRRDKMTTLPPLVNSEQHPHLPRYNRSM